MLFRLNGHKNTQERCIHLRLKQAKYEELMARLNGIADVDEIHKTQQIPRSTLLSLLAHKMVRETMRIFYSVKAKSKQLTLDWENGKHINDIARVCKLAPTLCASFIMSEKGFSKISFRQAVRDPSKIKDERLRKELAEAIKDDFIYSDWAAEEQRARGEAHERKLGEWLAKHGYEFWTEKDRQGEEKTPDFLLKKSSTFKGRHVHWFESKGYFGDGWEISRNYTKQLKKYVELFGPGVVVYCLGFVEDLKLPPDFNKNIMLTDEDDYKD